MPILFLLVLFVTLEITTNMIQRWYSVTLTVLCCSQVHYIQMLIDGWMCVMFVAEQVGEMWRLQRNVSYEVGISASRASVTV